MKRFLLLLFTFITFICCKGQQSFSSNFIKDINNNFRNEDVFKAYKKDITELKINDKIKNKDAIRKCRQEKKLFQRKYRMSSINLNLPVFGLVGIGSISTEALNSLNASGKASFYVRPVQFRNNALTIYASYNKNASNNDSILYNKLIFPDIGSSAFAGTIQLDKFWKYDDETGHQLSGFFEFAYKKIVSDSTYQNQALYFKSLNYTLGLKYIYGISVTDKDDAKKSLNLSFFSIPYISFLNIPDEDDADYRSLLLRTAKNTTFTSADSAIRDHITSIGVKIGFQVNSIQIFADFRSVCSSKKIPIRELKGFHSNIGFLFNADVFDIKRSKK